MSTKYTVRCNGNTYEVSYYPGSAGTYYDPPESSEIEILTINGQPDTSPENEEYEDLLNELSNLVEDLLAANEGEYLPEDFATDEDPTI